MRYLILMTLIWAFSFSFIGEVLSGKIDSYFAVLVRVSLASLLFLPFTKFRGIATELKLKIMLIGSVQIGMMYLFFYQSFLFLSVPEVILFTIFTPIYVTLAYDALKKEFKPLYLVSTGVAVLGAYIIRYHDVTSQFITGFLMIQGANICFAIGQSAYKKVMESHQNISQRDVFGYFHFGALIVSLVAFGWFGSTEKLSPTFTQWGVLLWLGVVASGLGYFLWNKGVCEVDAGVLGIMNNALVPAGLVMNLLIWGTPTNYTLLALGSGVIAFSLWLHHFFMKRYQTH
ncbi:MULTISPECIES: DMT family transporter [unclassified Sulfurospirillum]|uniref:DMT family transporter n=1 Tax=unclassified Sulfurospirillum TaxID=2618290 RepID=UPI0004FFD583|nr:MULTISPECIES: DMT family transporter [unclassified Sulfurospirillum]KFL34911.1 membrane protein [Sulfurospirillum sp. SCADC]